MWYHLIKSTRFFKTFCLLTFKGVTIQIYVIRVMQEKPSGY